MDPGPLLSKAAKAAGWIILGALVVAVVLGYLLG
jgi:hypothetical protein